jgi:hypothetical protein
LLLLLLLGTNAGDDEELADDREEGDGALLEDPGELEPLMLRLDPPRNAGSLKLASLLTRLEGLTVAEVATAAELLTWCWPPAAMLITTPLTVVEL